jgi:hypothetical protein
MAIKLLLERVGVVRTWLLCCFSEHSIAPFQYSCSDRSNLRHLPAWTSTNELIFQLLLKTKTSTPMTLSYIVLRGPVGDIKVNPRVYQFNFTENETETAYESVPLSDTAECNRLLAAKTINFRLIMFLASK